MRNTQTPLTLGLNTPSDPREGILQRKSDGQIKTKGEEELRDPLIVPTGAARVFLPARAQFASLLQHFQLM